MVLFRTPFRKRNWLVSAWNRSGTVVLHPDLHIDRRDLAFSGGGKVERGDEGTFVIGCIASFFVRMIVQPLFRSGRCVVVAALTLMSIPFHPYREHL